MVISFLWFMFDSWHPGNSGLPWDVVKMIGIYLWIHCLVNSQWFWQKFVSERFLWKSPCDGLTFLGTGRNQTRFCRCFPIKDQEFLGTGRSQIRFYVVFLDGMEIFGKRFMRLPLECGREFWGTGYRPIFCEGPSGNRVQEILGCW